MSHRLADFSTKRRAAYLWSDTTTLGHKATHATAAAMSGQIDPFLAIKLAVSAIGEQLAADEHRPT
jgi:hypothetical protein